jgi:succinate--hydroxymethylglutarate CoA-transferase
MATSIYTRPLARASRAIAHSNVSPSAFCNIRRRCFADVAADDMALPLKGYKVLDMTRVLAGVYSLYI